MTLNRTLPSLSVLRCFETAAKYESFSAAADELGLSQGAVSRHVRDLEAFVGAALFQREGRGVRLTPAGDALAREVSADLNRMRDTFGHAMAAGAHRKVIRLAAPPTFTSRWLLPRLPEFRRLHSDTEFVITSRSGPFDLTHARLDVAIHFGGWDWPNAQLTPLCPESLIAVAAPSLLPQGEPVTPDVLARLARLHMSDRPYLWEKVMTSFDLSLEGVRSGSYFDQFELVISAAKSGMGAAILPTYLIEKELEDGTLIKLADLPPDTSHQYYIALPLARQDPLISEFVTWLRAQIRDGSASGMQRKA